MAKQGMPPKVPPADHQAIAKEYLNTGITLQVLGDRYGVSRERIRQIIETVLPGTSKQRHDKQNRMDIEAIWQAVRKGAGNLTDITHATGMSYSRIHYLFNRYPEEFQGLRGLMVQNKPPARLRTEKRCPRCELVKPLEEFYHQKGAVDGRSTICAICVKKEVREYFHNRPEYEPVDHKICPACRRDLPRGRFYRAKMVTTGLQTYCKECQHRFRHGESVQDIVESHGYEYERRRFNE